MVVLLFFGCDTSSSTSETSGDEYLVVASFDNDYFGDGFDVSVYIRKNGAYYEADLNMVISGDPVIDAEVVVDSVPAEYNDWDAYELNNQDWAAGDIVSVSVTHPNISISDEIIVPVRPVVTSPSIVDHFAPGDEVPITWDLITPSPDELEIRVPWMSLLADDGSAIWEVLDVSQVSYSIPENTLDTSDPGAVVNINSINRKFLTGFGLDADSQIKFVNSAKLIITKADAL